MNKWFLQAFLLLAFIPLAILVGYGVLVVAPIFCCFLAINSYKFKNYNVKKFSIPIIMAFYLIFNVVIMIQYPWVHPYNQVAKTPEALNAHLSKYDNITIED